MTTTLSGIAEELERLDKLATPGPWVALDIGEIVTEDLEVCIATINGSDTATVEEDEANAALIALIRSNLPAFIEAATLIRTADDREKVLREALQAYLDDCSNEECSFCKRARQALGGTNA